MMKRITLVAAVILVTVSVNAIDTGLAFDDLEMQARYERLIAEVRCVTCQNQSIKDSNAFIAADLRREIRRLMVEGKNDDEIADFLVTRYGDFVLYRPRMSGRTLALWIAPFALFLLGGFALVRVVRHRMTMPLDDDHGDHQAGGSSK
jgi:cytochrome c-type biogenesis protein CcmH